MRLEHVRLADFRNYTSLDFAPQPGLDGQYTIFGQVTSGMEFIDAIKPGAPGSGAVTNPDKIIRMQVAADADKKKP